MSIDTAAHGLLVGIVVIASTASALAAPSTGYQTSLTRWTAAGGGFAGWERSGVLATQEGALRLDPATARAAKDTEPKDKAGVPFYNGGAFKVGEATSPILPVGFAYTQAIPSWTVDTPAATWTETLLRARVGGRWTRWYNLGVWASDTKTVHRHSVDGQKDADGDVSTDTLLLDAKAGAADAIQMKLRLFAAGSETPTVRSASVVVSTKPAKPEALKPGNKALWGRILPVPECSQMVYAGGGPVWCSPTSVSMVSSFWSKDGRPCEPVVRQTVEGVFDRVYDGHGNWSFNAAWAGSQGFDAYVTRFTSLADVEPWIAAGVPVVLSYSWGKDDLAGAPIPTSNGHLVLLVGFDAEGHPVINDPAAATDDAVQRTYRRDQLETVWLRSSGGSAYVIHPPGWKVPAL